MKNQLLKKLIDLGLSEGIAEQALSVSLFVLLIFFAFISYYLFNRVILSFITKIVKKSKNDWDNIAHENKVFKRLSHIAPALVIYKAGPIFFISHPTLSSFVTTLALVYMIIAILLVLDSFLSTVLEIYQKFEISKQVPIKGFVQAIKIVITFLGGIFILSAITGKTPIAFLSGLGALTAVLMLVFKDAILGFVAGIQLSANKMVQKDDWIEMPQYGADGSVIDVSLTTVKIQNWDKTITTIPTYSLISHSFKNWSGMTKSGGRRIKRSIIIDMKSIKFLDDDMLKRLSSIQLITEYIENKIKEISNHNKSLNFIPNSMINGRNLTNIGIFREYAKAYLKNHPKINKSMTFLVRQLEPSATGLPIQIYVFSSDQVWANYEMIQADIFDHLLASLTEFDLSVFQYPTGYDMNLLNR